MTRFTRPNTHATQPSNTSSTDFMEKNCIFKELYERIPTEKTKKPLPA